MNEVLEKLYENTIHPNNKEMSSDREYLYAKNRANQLYETLRERLPKEEVQRLDRMVASSNRQMERENIRFFTNGFKLGLTFAVENMQ